MSRLKQLDIVDATPLEELANDYADLYQAPLREIIEDMIDELSFFLRQLEEETTNE